MVIVVASGGRPFAGSAGAWLKEHQPGPAARAGRADLLWQWIYTAITHG